MTALSIRFAATSGISLKRMRRKVIRLTSLIRLSWRKRPYLTQGGVRYENHDSNPE